MLRRLSHRRCAAQLHGLAFALDLAFLVVILEGNLLLRSPPPRVTPEDMTDSHHERRGKPFMFNNIAVQTSKSPAISHVKSKISQTPKNQPVTMADQLPAIQ